eukprot:Gregarina_sp_Pseudo_9__1673@NODE_2128_length_1135_cov_42_065693_g1964_i0_p1_GENE_NODE_2128_length_1135_cov_42_065693_g1964_i0NODE_2128_length_1135_cov_42_065693_g1964_i0_p1_ORF_typecomplete_len263_score76_59DUF3278/PF11683_8/1DUF3278/PF11683_8/2_3e03DUF3278/PF11683_8/6_9e02_NODE_2128_length_1135_cov_42_065693_g1964_i02961084
MSDSTESNAEAADISDDIWLLPQDTRLRRRDCDKLWDVVVIGASLLTLTFGVGVLLWNDWTKREAFVYWYVVASMTIELLCLGITGTGMLLIVSCLGQTGLAHAISVVSILNEVLFCFAYMMTAVWGGLTIKLLLEECGYDVRKYVRTGNGDFLLDKTALLVYVFFSFLVCCLYTLSAIPGFIGIVHFAVHQIKSKIDGTPIVSFYRQYNRGDEFYVRVMPVDDLAEYVTRMDNPIAIRSGSTTHRDEKHTLLSETTDVEFV